MASVGASRYLTVQEVCSPMKFQLGLAVLSAVPVIGFLGAMPGQAQETSPFSPGNALHVFQEARRVCDAEMGALWGRNLYGPMLLVEPATREVFANQRDAQGKLVARDGVYAGRLPAEVMIANTATQWAGVRWTMILWPSLNTGVKARERLMAHELWHRIQPELGLPAAQPPNAHLDTPDGRYWMELEWRALKVALTAAGGERRQAIQDALTFRTVRRRLWLPAAAEERALELNEGLAEYTGIRATNNDLAGAFQDAVEGLEKASHNPTFNRSFAYATGPAYGLLLDSIGDTTWRSRLKPDTDLSELLLRGTGLLLPDDLSEASQARAQVYGGPALQVQEQERQQRRDVELAGYRSRFLAGPVLVIPLQKPNVSFDPRNLIPVGEQGTLYPTLELSDEWGVLKVSGGALLSKDWSSVRVSAPAAPSDGGFEGEGWILQVRDGWTVLPGSRPGDFRLAKKLP